MKVNLYYDKYDDNYYFRLNNKRVIIEVEEFIFLKKVFDLYSQYEDYKKDFILCMENLKIINDYKRGKRK